MRYAHADETSINGGNREGEIMSRKILTKEQLKDIVRSREVRDESFRSIGRRLGFSHVAIMKAYNRVKNNSAKKEKK